MKSADPLQIPSHIGTRAFLFQLSKETVQGLLPKGMAATYLQDLVAPSTAESDESIVGIYKGIFSKGIGIEAVDLASDPSGCF